jgi:hypothetical protein
VRLGVRSVWRVGDSLRDGVAIAPPVRKLARLGRQMMRRRFPSML